MYFRFKNQTKNFPRSDFFSSCKCVPNNTMSPIYGHYIDCVLTVSTPSVAHFTSNTINLWLNRHRMWVRVIPVLALDREQTPDAFGFRVLDDVLVRTWGHRRAASRVPPHTVLCQVCDMQRGFNIFFCGLNVPCCRDQTRKGSCKLRMSFLCASAD